MKITTHVEGRRAIVAVEGRLDAKTAPDLDAAIAGLPTEVADLVLDFSELAYISSMGLRTIHTAKKRFAAAGGGVTLRKVRPALREILDVSGFSPLLNFED